MNKKNLACIMLSLLLFLGLGLNLFAQGTAPASGAPADGKGDADPAKKMDTQNSPILDFFKSTQVFGLVDVYYGYNFNEPADQSVGLRGLETKSNSFQLNLVKLTFNRPAAEKNSMGYRFDLMYGPAADSYTAFESMGGQQSILKNLQQAYVSYNAPLGNGLTIDFGKYATFIGAEVLETIDNWNYQQSVLFAYAQPYYHTGVRTSYAFSDKFAMGAYVVNGWNNSFDNNTGKSVGASATWTPCGKFQLIQSWLGGPEKTGTNEGWRHLFDTVGNITLNDYVAFKVNYDYGFEKNLAPLENNSIWSGVAVSGHFNSKNKKHALAPRFEYFIDHAGLMTGQGQHVKEFTLTYDLRLRPNFSTKFEYRGDFSDVPYFKKEADRLSKSQNTFIVGVVYAFGFGKD